MALPYAGDIIDAADTRKGWTFVIKKAANENSTSTTLQDDDDLAAALAVGLWRVEIALTATGATGNDIKTAWSNTGTMTIVRSCIGPNLSTTSTDDGGILSKAVTSTSSVSYGLTSGNHYIREELYCDVTVAGTLQLQWAQNTATGTTTLSSSSRMFITQLEEYA